MGAMDCIVCKEDIGYQIAYCTDKGLVCQECKNREYFSKYGVSPIRGH